MRDSIVVEPVEASLGISEPQPRREIQLVLPA